MYLFFRSMLHSSEGTVRRIDIGASLHTIDPDGYSEIGMTPNIVLVCTCCCSPLALFRHVELCKNTARLNDISSVLLRTSVLPFSIRDRYHLARAVALRASV